MGDQRERNRIKSRVDELPDEIRAQLDAMLADVNYTYQDIADTITDLGYEISRSAVGRYAMRWDKVFAVLTLSVVPILILYLFLQKYFIRGLMAGAVKG